MRPPVIDLDEGLEFIVHAVRDLQDEGPQQSLIFNTKERQEACRTAFQEHKIWTNPKFELSVLISFAV